MRCRKRRLYEVTCYIDAMSCVLVVSATDDRNAIEIAKREHEDMERGTWTAAPATSAAPLVYTQDLASGRTSLRRWTAR